MSCYTLVALSAKEASENVLCPNIRALLLATVQTGKDAAIIYDIVEKRVLSKQLKSNLIGNLLTDRCIQDYVRGGQDRHFSEACFKAMDLIRRHPNKEEAQFFVLSTNLLIDEYVNLNLRISPIFINGDLRLCLCTISHAALTRRNTYLTNLATSQVWEMRSETFRQIEPITLNSKEQQIVIYAHRGYTMRDTAKALGLSPETVKSYRKIIINKLRVRNMTETVSYAMLHSLV